MAITIIGESKAAGADVLSFPEHNLPAPETAPVLQEIWSTDEISKLLRHEHPMIRTFALRKIADTKKDDLFPALIERIEDPDPAVARTAIEIVGELNLKDAIENLTKIFSSSTGELAADAAVALGRIEPQILADLVRKRGRLDDYAYAITTMQLARVETEDARAYLKKAMDRAGALSTGRRVALYTAGLMSGDTALIKRVLANAMADSRTEPKEGEPDSAARLAVGAAAGLPASMSRISAGEALLKSIAPESDDRIQDDAQKVFVASLRNNEPVKAIQGLAPLTVHGVSEMARPELQSAGRRCRALLDILIEQAPKMTGFSPEALAVFAAAALDSAAVVHSSQNNPAEAPALIALGKVFEIEPNVFIESSSEELRDLFSTQTSRDVRQTCKILAVNPIEEDLALDKIVTALVTAENGTAVIDAAAEAQTEHLGRALLRVARSQREHAETIALEALQRRPLEEHVATLALIIAAELGTKRLSLAIGRRFLELRKIDRMRFANAIIKLGDLDLIEMVKARAYADEPEEAAWVLLSLLGNHSIENELAEATARVKKREELRDDYRLALPLQCENCGELLTYRMFSVFIDPQATDRHGDPAFVGDTRCKACGVEDKLKATDIAARIMTESMMSALANFEQGKVSEAPPRVVPRRTRYNGKDMSVADAARQADKDVIESPESIRAHLRRARIRLLLRRYNTIEDAGRAKEIDPRSAEAMYVMAGALAQKGDLDEAVRELVEARDILLAEENPRLYEETKEVLLREADNSLLQLENLGAKIPEELDLSKARKEEEERIEAFRRRQAGIETSSNK
ncbi:MAG: HEAT repeat domain-containing protein [Myxococcota bacterium]|nr:HEAT repeat domain-containing protein [Myxococcota bacterium]